MSEVVKQSEFEDEPVSWLAFRYISDELSDAEVVEFEARLNPESPAFELEACEAVSRAVRLNDVVSEAVESAVQHAAPSTNVEHGRRDVFARRVSLLAASVTVVAVGWALTFPTSPKPVQVVDSPAPLTVVEDPGDVSGELVQIWADSGDELLSAVEEVQIQPADDASEFFSDDVPDWLLAAVQTQDASPDSPEVMEN